MKILVMGATGLLGNAMMRYLSEDSALEVYGTARAADAGKYFAPAIGQRIITGIDVMDHQVVADIIAKVKPDVTINCIGLVKQRPEASDPLKTIPLNSLLPHLLAKLTGDIGGRFIHISTDCVFSGNKGNYLESDASDATDLYGRSKFLGEVDYPNALTLRTSYIGHELSTSFGLVGWFLAQEGTTNGFTRAIYSGVPTVELARVVKEFILPNSALHGLYHVASAPIDKYTLLQLMAAAYKKNIEIIPKDALAIDRSLNADKFRAATGYVAPAWPDLVERMTAFK